MDPRISVVIITYNFARYLGECIESILAQTLRPYEIIVCDDCSQDGSREIIERYMNLYPGIIKGYIQKENVGVANNGVTARNLASGDLISWLDGDDRWLPRKLELEWKALSECPEAKVAYSNVYTIDSDGKRIGVWYDGKGPEPPTGDVFISVYSKKFFKDSGSVMRNTLFYRSCLDEIGNFDTALESHWDWDEKIRLTARYPVAYSGEALVEYRKHQGGFSMHFWDKRSSAMFVIYEKYQHLLEGRALKDRLQVELRIKSMIALLQSRISGGNRNNVYSALDVCESNYKLLQEADKALRKELKDENSALLLDVARQAIVQRLSTGDKSGAVRCLAMYPELLWRTGCLKLASRFLPGYNVIKALYKSSE